MVVKNYISIKNGVISNSTITKYIIGNYAYDDNYNILTEADTTDIITDIKNTQASGSQEYLNRSFSNGTSSLYISATEYDAFKNNKSSLSQNQKESVALLKVTGFQKVNESNRTDGDILVSGVDGLYKLTVSELNPHMAVHPSDNTKFDLETKSILYNTLVVEGASNNETKAVTTLNLSKNEALNLIKTSDTTPVDVMKITFNSGIQNYYRAIPLLNDQVCKYTSTFSPSGTESYNTFCVNCKIKAFDLSLNLHATYDYADNFSTADISDASRKDITLKNYSTTNPLGITTPSAVIVFPLIADGAVATSVQNPTQKLTIRRSVIDGNTTSGSSYTNYVVESFDNVTIENDFEVDCELLIYSEINDSYVITPVVKQKYKLFDNIGSNNINLIRAFNTDTGKALVPYTQFEELDKMGYTSVCSIFNNTAQAVGNIILQEGEYLLSYIQGQIKVIQANSLVSEIPTALPSFVGQDYPDTGLYKNPSKRIDVISTQASDIINEKEVPLYTKTVGDSFFMLGAYYITDRNTVVQTNILTDIERPNENDVVMI